jgi:tetratricopeptide (TPR) repeat protein
MSPIVFETARALALWLALGPTPARAASTDTPASFIALSTTFMRTARATGDPSYYDRAGAALDRALAVDPSFYPAFRARAWVQMGMHRFRAALRTARAARRIAPRDWWNYGNLADACSELGYYRGAAHATDRMMALRPGVPAYTRVAALRALTGDRRGAIEALELAFAASDPGDAEERAWILTYLGHERWALGDVAAAARLYEAALVLAPGYHLALPGLARTRAAEGRLDDAIALYERTLAVAPLPSTAGALGDLYAATGNPSRARDSYDLAMVMQRVAAARGQSLGRDLAMFLADHDRDLDEAVRLARADASRRDDVYTDDALAWTLYKRGDLGAAKRAASRALRLGTEEAAFHRHAEAIAVALDRPRAAARHARLARALEPVDATAKTVQSRKEDA